MIMIICKFIIQTLPKIYHIDIQKLIIPILFPVKFWYSLNETAKKKKKIDNLQIYYKKSPLLILTLVIHILFLVKFESIPNETETKLYLYLKLYWYL